MVVLAAAACGSSKKKSSTTTTTASSSSSSSSSEPTTSSSKPSVVTDTFPTTTTTPGGARTAETNAKAFFAAWQANDATKMHSLGTSAAVSAALGARASGTSGYVFSNCQGAAGSTYCTWVKRGSRILVQATNQTPYTVVGFQRQPLSAQQTANEFFTGYQDNNAAVVGALANAATATKTAGIEAHRSLAWIPPQNCDGAAGSIYCTWTAGSSKFVVRVVEVNPPPQVGDVTYTP
jgi:hypothetical protein